MQTEYFGRSHCPQSQHITQPLLLYGRCHFTDVSLWTLSAEDINDPQQVAGWGLSHGSHSHMGPRSTPAWHQLHKLQEASVTLKMEKCEMVESQDGRPRGSHLISSFVWKPCAMRQGSHFETLVTQSSVHVQLTLAKLSHAMLGTGRSS